MKLKVEFTAKFKKDLKLAQKRNLNVDKIFDVIEKLSNKQDLEAKFKDHQLINYGNNKNTRECHIEPDWLLIYQIQDEKITLLLVGTGSHSNLF